MQRFRSRRQLLLSGASSWAVMLALKPEAWVSKQDAARSA
jgi:hypothetical protein